MWKYQISFGFSSQLPIISLGEGNTPLVPDHYRGLNLAYKCEFQNPTGSFKDRGSSLLASFLKFRQVETTIEDSSGNAGASWAAYSARAGIPTQIYVPESTSGPKKDQITAYGAEIIPVSGGREKAAQAVLKTAESGICYASHAWLPFGMAGIATIAYEIYEQSGAIPAMVIAPVGHGSLLLGVARGFKALIKAGVGVKMPVLIGVQSQRCNPVDREFHHLKRVAEDGLVPDTLAEGVKVAHPTRMEPLVKVVRESGGEIISIPEKEILPARDELAKRGMYVEPTSALVWAALKVIPPPETGEVILILTGSGLKYRENG